MANPAPSHLHERLREEELETPNEQILAEEGDTDDDNDDDEETTDDDEDDEEESPPRVLDSGQGSVGDGEKRRRVEKGGESCWMSGIESGDCSQGSQWNRTEIDGLFCPICMDAWTDNGDHHISCLPCGHIYGFSCIKKWFQQRRSSGKCPQCNRTCSLKDVRKLFASRIVAVDEESQKRIQFLEAKCAYLEKKCGYRGREKHPAPADLDHDDNTRDDEQQAAELSEDGLAPPVDELQDIHEEFNTLRHDLSRQVADLSRQVADLRDEFHTFRHEVSDFMRGRQGAL